MLLTTLETDSGYVATILPAELLLGLGMGLTMTPAINLATRGIEPRYAGVAAATAHVSMQLGGSVGTALLNSIAVGAAATYAVAHGPGPASLVHGFAVATGWAAALLLVVAAVTTVLLSGTGALNTERTSP